MYKLFFFIALFSALIFSQTPKVKIINISVEGNERLSSEDIIRSSRLYQDREIDMRDIQKSVRTLWNLRRFSDIQVFVDEESDEGVALRIVVEELPILEEISFEGNKKLSDRTIKELISLNAGQVLPEYLTFQAKEDIRAEYIDKHFHDVEIETETIPGELPFSQKLTFKIKENKKMKVRAVNFIGNENFSDYRLSRKLKNTKPWKLYFPWRGKFDKVKFEEDQEILKAYYRSKGYRDFHIVEKTLEPTPDGKGLGVTLTVFEGPKYFVRAITWEGNLIHTDKELADRLGFEHGDVFDELQFQMALSEKVNPLYMDEGYLYFQLYPEITPVGKDSLDINFVITETQKVSIRKILITGNDRTHENVIRRELRVFPGDIFNRTKLMDSHRDIIMLDYFDTVLPDVVPISDDQIDIKIDVSEKSADRANFSISYNETYGFGGGGGVEFRNFRGRGQNLSLNYTRGLGSGTSTSSSSYDPYSSSDVSSFESYSVSFVNPWVFDTPNLIGVSISYSERGRGQGNYYPFDITKTSGSIRLGRRFKWPDRFFRGSWVFYTSGSKYFASAESDLTEYFGTSIENNINYDGDENPYFSTAGLSINQVITRDSRNHPEFPTAGSKFVWSSTLSGSFLGGDEDYHKHELNIEWFTPTVSKFVLHQKMKMGVIKKIPVKGDQRSIIPPYARFLLGGSGIPYGEMLRGYEDNTVGPIGTYQPSGGNVMLKYALEIRFPFSDQPTVYGLLFAEAGNVWSDFDRLDPFDLKRSAGGGVRVFMPMIGMLGFDAGYGFDDTNYDYDSKPQGWEYHILFGMPF